MAKKDKFEISKQSSRKREGTEKRGNPLKWESPQKPGRQKVGYGTVVDGFAKFQALNFGISGPEIFEGFSF